MAYSKLKMVWNWFHAYCLTHEFSVLPCSSMFYDMSSHPSLNHIHQAEGPGEVNKKQIHDVQEKTTNDRLLEFFIYLSHTYIYTYTHDFRRGFRFPRTSRNLQSCDTIIHVWSSNIQKGGCGINVLWTALEPRCCYVEDVFTLKMLKMLLCWNGGCAFRPWFSGELWHFYGIHENTEILSARNSTGFYGNKIKWRTWKTWN